MYQQDLLPLVQQAVFHSYLKDSVIFSGLHVLLPISGNMEHPITLERRISAEINARDEESFASFYFYTQLKYLLEQATAYESPVYQTDDDGNQTHIGNSVIFIDRDRLISPRLETNADGDLFLNCVKPSEKQ